MEEPDDPAMEEATEDDCHMEPSGFCEAAGSHYCEFVCPYRWGF